MEVVWLVQMIFRISRRDFEVIFVEVKYSPFSGWCI